MIRSILAVAALAFAVPAVAAEPARGVTDAEIVIGTYTDLSGVTAMWGVNNSNSWRMVFDQVNAAGGINAARSNISSRIISIRFPARCRRRTN